MKRNLGNAFPHRPCLPVPIPPRHPAICPHVPNFQSPFSIVSSLTEAGYPDNFTSPLGLCSWPSSKPSLSKTSFSPPCPILLSSLFSPRSLKMYFSTWIDPISGIAGHHGLPLPQTASKNSGQNIRSHYRKKKKNEAKADRLEMEIEAWRSDLQGNEFVRSLSLSFFPFLIALPWGQPQAQS